MNEVLISRFKEKLRGGAVFGPFMKTLDPAFVEAAGYAGMDFAILDMEHGPIGVQSMQNNIRAAQLAQILPVIRVGELSEEAIGKALDIGAAGVQIPQITCGEDARRAVAAAKFYPMGERGVCRFVRAAHYSSMPRDEYFNSANQNLVIVQLEGSKAIENLEEILEVEGVDIIFVGPYDLSQSLGVPGQTTNPIVVEQMEKIVARARKKGVAAGIFTDTPATMETWLKAGVQYISYSVDVGIFTEACADLVAGFNKALSK